MGGGFFHRNEKFQNTKVIYFMLGTSSLMGGSKIQILHFIIIPYLWIDLQKSSILPFRTKKDRLNDLPWSCILDVCEEWGCRVSVIFRFVWCFYIWPIRKKYLWQLTNYSSRIWQFSPLSEQVFPVVVCSCVSQQTLFE